MTVTAADRVGIVHSVAGSVRERGGNVVEMSQTVLKGYFTIILAVEFLEAQDRRELGERIAEEGEAFGLTVAVIEAEAGASEPPVPDGERFILTVLGSDQFGAIHGIAGRLAAHGVNIVDLHAVSEGSRFSMVMEAYLPPDLPPGLLRDDLLRFGSDLGLEVFVQHEEIFRATNEPTPVRVGPGVSRGGMAVVPH